MWRRRGASLVYREPQTLVCCLPRDTSRTHKTEPKRRVPPKTKKKSAPAAKDVINCCRSFPKNTKIPTLPTDGCKTRKKWPGQRVGCGDSSLSREQTSRLQILSFCASKSKRFNKSRASSQSYRPACATATTTRPTRMSRRGGGNPSCTHPPTRAHMQGGGSTWSVLHDESTQKIEQHARGIVRGIARTLHTQRRRKLTTRREYKKTAAFSTASRQAETTRSTPRLCLFPDTREYIRKKKKQRNKYDSETCHFLRFSRHRETSQAPSPALPRQPQSALRRRSRQKHPIALATQPYTTRCRHTRTVPALVKKLLLLMCRALKFQQELSRYIAATQAIQTTWAARTLHQIFHLF